MRLGDWKAVKTGPKAKIKLFDLALDPKEQNDLAETHPGLVSRIKGMMEAARTPSEHFELVR